MPPLEFPPAPPFVPPPMLDQTGKVKTITQATTLAEPRTVTNLNGKSTEALPPLNTTNTNANNLNNIKGSNILESRAYPNYPDLQLPVSNGKWIGEGGNSGWRSDNPAVNKITKGEPVPFKDGYVDFSKWSKGDVTLGKVTGENKIDFPAADKEYAEKMDILKKNGAPNAAEVFRMRRKDNLTWHHVPNSNRLELIPTDLHGNVPHSGSASQSRNAAKGQTNGQ